MRRRGGEVRRGGEEEEEYEGEEGQMTCKRHK